MVAKHVWQTALVLIRQHPHDAPKRARDRAVIAMKAARHREMKRWVAVAIALEDFLKKRPSETESVH